jgi:predicted metal-dependent phosphoesterase TrpH
MKADLHTHTIFSDGALSPEDLVRKAKEIGISSLGITDHDSISGFQEATVTAKKLGIDIIPGIELSATHRNNEVHILGYYIDCKNGKLLEALAVFRQNRFHRAERIVNKLNRMNVPLKMESVLDNSDGDVIGRPHIATAMVNGGHIESYREAFDKYIGNGRPAYEKKIQLSVKETIDLIAEAGGLSFLAHPGYAVDENVLLEIIRTGIDGIETVYPTHTPELTCYYRGIVSEYDLLETGGSDFHGGLRDDEEYFGKTVIPCSVVETMKLRLSVK